MSANSANSTSAVNRVTAWRSLVWAGVVGSIVAWSWVWVVSGGVSLVMLLVAVATVVLAWRGMQGMRAAMAGVMVAGLAMFLSSLYLTAMLFVNATQVTAMNVIVLGVFPMVAAIVLLVGSGVGFRHVFANQRHPTAA
jgi:hypothetical protein